MLKASTINHHTDGQQASGGLNWWVFLWASVVFIIYGSLFPFNFQSEVKPIQEFFAAWHMFRNIPDASDNFLLFIPLGIGLDACLRGRNRRLLASMVAWLLLGVGIQLIQLYLPNRTAAVSDALWNAVGMLFGFMAFKRVRLMVDQLKRSSTGPQDSFAMLLVLLWFCYESFPFVPTLDVGLLREHIKPVVIAPPFELMRLVQHALAALLAGVAMLRANWLQTRWLNVVIPGTLAVFLEIIVAYGSLRRETLLGIIGGLLVSYWITARVPKKAPAFVIGIAFIALLITVLTPYRGQALGATFTFTPFADIFWKGVTVDVAPSAFEALSIGVLLWSATSLLTTPRITKIAWAGVFFALLLVLELVRMFVVGYHGDTTPMVMFLLLSSFSITVENSKKKFQLQHFTRVNGDDLEADKLKSTCRSTYEYACSVDDEHIQTNSSKNNINPSIKYNYVLYCIGLIVFILYIIFSGYRRDIGLQWLVYWGAGLLMLAFAPKNPAFGIIIYVILGYGISSNGPEYDISLALRLRDGIAFFAIVAWILAKNKDVLSHQILRLIPIVVTGFFLWLALTAFIAWAQGMQLGPILRFDPSTYIHAAIMFLLVADLLREREHHIGLAILIACTALGRAFLQGLDGVYLESYVATLLTIGLPIAGIVVLISRRILWRIIFGIIVILTLCFLVATQNRNSAVAISIIALVFIFKLRINLVRKISILVAAIGFVVLAIPSQYYGRFSALWDSSVNQIGSGLDRSTAEARLTLWKTGLEIARDHLFFGVGPGNFAYYLKLYSPGQGRLGAHNSYLQALVETGFIGLILYLALFLSTYVLLYRIQENTHATWQAHVARMLQLSLIAYLALGLFNNRNDLVLAYMVAGWAVALKFSLPPVGIDLRK